MPPSSILLIEDEPEGAAIVGEALTREGYEVVWRATASAGLSEAGLGQHHLIILDRMLGNTDGLNVLTTLREAGITTPILVLSALARSENRIDGLDSGADDYLGKPFEPKELLARVRALIRRSQNRMHSAILIYGDLELHVKSRTAHRAGRHLALSPKEFEILKLLMEHAGDVVTRDMLLQKVWRLNFDPQTNVIDVNMSRLRNRLEDGFEQPVLETVRGIGFRLICPVSEANL
ncbi:response regulator transcription factor [Asticcacaulis excentricus]|uniref:Two component transcriptional regulator, winged helix family n=1 Tax=Asticcacaulis excentricus (strain ATCC 15261 / DSM 4724 / KCTC 12464 / NCIMB 9791 / VKM B-1370 / CB 48) TaxID=573065 RepID=E8RQZ8_ASTEC|nr:response regulator transcription factor [Asticcacaulis excentricus]ADU12261.1 two component transcriptional regulator, winged helix family [Asticcacaulis excentricus CB 48]